MKPEAAFVLKVDVDTHVGLREGAPRLLDLFAKHGIRASWFVTMGPDRTGRSVLRVFKQKGFLRKMMRSGAPSLYPLSTMLRGTLLPSVPVVANQPERLVEIENSGHELGIHGFDHVYWHDDLALMAADEVNAEVGRAATLFEEILGRSPDCFAAPGWQCTADSLRATDALGLRHRSDTRGTAPYRPRVDGYESPTPEMPTTLPTLDEILGRIGTTNEELNAAYKGWIDPGALNVHTIHTEVEGSAYLGQLDSLLERVRDQLPVRTLGEVVTGLGPAADLPLGSVAPGRLPGRGGTVACQVAG
ncbi:MAG: polysaccharide deacetylase family protein [Candidatus Binatia bacterium]|nr:polysaccharide deacetylase family protein [Candidatus Binatia bacterium]